MSSVRNTEKMRDEVLASVGRGVQMTMGTHMSIKAEAKNLEIFSLHRWNRTRAEQLSGSVTWPLG